MRLADWNPPVVLVEITSPKKIVIAFRVDGRHSLPPSLSGRSVAWLARLFRVQEVVSSNLTAPTIFPLNLPSKPGRKGLQPVVRREKKSSESFFMSVMEWLWTVLIVLIAAGLPAFARASFVPVDEARRLLGNGAVIVDVRTMEEFQSGHLPQTLNIPLSRLREQIGPHVPDRNQVVLVHCQAGGRSEIARRRLKKMGYVNVYNLGSLVRARQIASSSTD